jgi:hypothetical protein
MPSTKYLKVKERLILVLRIENLNKEANPYSYYRRQVYRCLINPKESSYYSNSSSLKTTPVARK